VHPPGGDSAGGNLAISALAHLRDTSRLPAPPAGALLISPCVDLTNDCVMLQEGDAGRYDYLPKGKLAEAMDHIYTEVGWVDGGVERGVGWVGVGDGGV